jgi:RHS repeat-associated protein
LSPDGSTILTSYTYTAATNLIATRTDGTQGTTAFGWDWARRETSVSAISGAFAGMGTVTRTYRLDGLLASQSFPGSLTETLGYDPAKRPISIGLGAAGSLSQGFDRAGDVTSDGRSLSGIAGDAGSNTQSFSYDGLHRLTAGTGLATASAYQYDLDGNRTRKVDGALTTDYAYDRADQLQSQTIAGTPHTFDYDRYGNLTSSWDATNAQTTYGYDEASRLVASNPPGGAGAAIGFTIDALDRPATRSTGGTLSDTYAYLDATDIAYLTGSGTPTGALLDAECSRLAVRTGAQVSWLVFDLHGSVAALCPAGFSTLSDAYRYDGWGVQVASAGTAANPYRYRGLLNLANDMGLGALLAMGARDYSPQLGTFTQEDSVAGSAADPATMNRYLYALANPATLVDPDGHMAATAADTGGYVLPIRTQRDDGSNCSRACIERRISREPAASVAEAVRHRDSPWADQMFGTGADLRGTRWDLTPRKIGGCVGGSVAVPLVAGAQVCLVGSLDDLIAGRLYVSRTYTPLTQGAVGIGGSVAVQGLVTNARTGSDLRDWFVNVGAAGGLGPVLAGDLAVGRASDGYGVYTLEAGGGLGARFDFHGGATISYVDPLLLPWYSPQKLVVPSLRTQLAGGL